MFHDGHCAVAERNGQCGVIDRKGHWIIYPAYHDIETFTDYAICHQKDRLLQVDYEGNILNDALFDDLTPLTFSEEERIVDGDGNVRYVTRSVATGLFAYSVQAFCGLMDGTGHRITDPVYSAIHAIARNRFRAVLLDDYSEVLINEKGEELR